MQIAAMNPGYVSSDEIPAEIVEQEKAVQLAKAMEEGATNTKIPAEKAKMIAENKVKGRMNNFFAEVCLLNQAFVKGEQGHCGRPRQGCCQEPGRHHRRQGLHPLRDRRGHREAGRGLCR